MRDAVIVDAVRTPVGRRGGALAGAHPVDLSAVVLRALADRVGLDPALVDDVIWGCVSQVGEQGLNVGRNAVLAAGWPDAVPATTLDRQCGSSQQALHFAAAGVVSGQYDVAVAGGVESMTPGGDGRERPQRSGAAVRPGDDAPATAGSPFNQGVSAEMVAGRWGLTREDVDRYSVQSHQRAAAARGRRGPSPTRSSRSSWCGRRRRLGADGEGDGDQDEGIRPGTTAEVLAGLRPAFEDGGTVTAGNASQISDGAAALLVTTSEVARGARLAPAGPGARRRAWSASTRCSC